MRKDQKAQFQLLIEGDSSGITLGASKSRAFVIVGRDSNGNGTGDAVLINGERKLWAWKFTFDPFSGTGANYKRSLFGDKSGVPFLFKGRSKNDSLAVLESRGNRAATIRYRGLNSKRVVRTIRLGGVVVGNEAPLLLRNQAGADDIVFVDSSDEATVAVTVNSRGRVIGRNNYRPKVTVVSGYFSSLAYEELAYIESEELVVGENPDKGRALIGGLTHKGVKEYLGEEFSPTPLPVVTLLNPSPVAIGSVSPAPTSTAYPTYTLYPTNTNTATFTPTLTATSTATSTATNTSTSTPTPTATATNTATITPTPIAYMPYVHGDGSFDSDVGLDNYLTGTWPTATPTP